MPGTWYVCDQMVWLEQSSQTKECLEREQILMAYAVHQTLPGWPPGQWEELAHAGRKSECLLFHKLGV